MGGMLMFLFGGLGYVVASITFLYALSALGRLIVPQAGSIVALEELAGWQSGDCVRPSAVRFQGVWLVSVIPKPG